MSSTALNKTGDNLDDQTDVSSNHDNDKPSASSQQPKKLTKRQRKKMEKKKWTKSKGEATTDQVPSNEDGESSTTEKAPVDESSFCCSLPDLPSEVMYVVLQYISRADRRSLRLTCNVVRQQVDDSSFWVHRNVNLLNVTLYDDCHMWDLLQLRRLKIVSLPDDVDFSGFSRVLMNVNTIEVVHCKCSVFNTNAIQLKSLPNTNATQLRSLPDTNAIQLGSLPDTNAIQSTNLPDLPMLCMTLDWYHYTTSCRCGTILKAMDGIKHIQVSINLKRQKLPRMHQIQDILDLKTVKEINCLVPQKELPVMKGKKRSLKFLKLHHEQITTRTAYWIENLKTHVGKAMKVTETEIQ